MEFHLFSQVFICLLFVWRTFGFNVDTKSAYIYRKPPSKTGTAYFGYTVTLHSNGPDKSVLVGAPIDNVTSSSDGSILTKFGDIYKCKFNAAENKADDCKPQNVDNDPDRTTNAKLNNLMQELKLEEKSGQWLGGTLHSTGKNGQVVVCAPRYIWRDRPPREDLDLHYRWVLGRCFKLRPDLRRSSLKIDPCGSKTKGNNFYGYCQAGFSAQYTPDDVVVLGAVGITRWKGGVVAQLPDTTDPVFSTQDQIEIGDYMGYSVTYGHFSAADSTEFVGGAPRAEGNMGKVLMYDNSAGNDLQVTSPLPQPKNLKFGSYFGSVLCAVDLNNDKFTDILVGAPQYTEVQDEGRVFVYINNKKGAVDYVESMTLVGDGTKGARFGSAIAAVGDLNKDGYQDVAIGSPYDGPDQGGAVFIYHGTKNGIETKYRQKILASELTKKFGAAVKTFGNSIGGALDVDDNKYDDIAVGAFGSENAFLFRTRRIIDVDGRVTLSSDQIVLENNKSQCMDLTDNSVHKCINITVEFKFEDRDALSPKDLNLSYEIILDVEQGDLSDQFRRMYFIDNGKKSFSLARTCTLKNQRVWGCKSEETVYLRDKNRIVDKLSSLTLLTKFDIVHDSCKLCPILNDYRPKEIRNEASFLKECAGKVCQPDLELKSNFKFEGGYRELRIGAVEELTVEVDVTNLASDASYRSRVLITYPGGIGYIGLRLEDEGVQCSNEAPSNGTGTVTCEVGNPLKAKAKRAFGIRFSTVEVKGDTGTVVINVLTTSANKDTDDSNNKQELKIPVKVEADLAITGTIDRQEIVYSGVATNQDILPKVRKDIGPLVAQTFTVTNNGPSAVEAFKVDLQVPLRLTEHINSYLLYILQIELLGSAGSCSVKVNPLNIPITNSTETEENESKRRRRDTSSTTEQAQSLTCNRAKACSAFTCRFGRLLKGKRIDIKISSRLWINTLLTENPGVTDIITIGKVNLEDETEIIQSTKENDEYQVKLRVKPQSDSVKVKTPIWIFIVSALGGVLLLALAAFLMYRYGFFKRKKMPRNISNPTAEDTPMAFQNKALL